MNILNTKVKKLQVIVENIVKRGRYVNMVYEVLKRSKERNAQNLIELYEKHFKSNKNIFKGQLKLRKMIKYHECLINIHS